MADASRTTRPYWEAGRWLAAERRRRKISQEQFAELIGRNQTTISNYETGKIRPSDAAAAVIAQVFRMSESSVRRGLGLYVPGRREPAATEDGNVLRLPHGVTLTPKQRRALDAMLDAFLDDLERADAAG